MIPPQFVPGVPFGRLKLSNTPNDGNPEGTAAVAVGVFVRVGVEVKVAELVKVGEGGMGVNVGVEVDGLVLVKVGDNGVFVKVFVAVEVTMAVPVNVAVLVEVLVGVSVEVFVGVNAGVLVLVGVLVAVRVGVRVAVFVGVKVNVGVAVVPVDKVTSSPSTTCPANPFTEPSQYKPGPYVHVVVDPNVPGVQIKISAPSPAAPVTEKAPSVLRWICPFDPLIQTPPKSSLAVSANPTSDPSKYIVHVPLVVDPSEVGENASRSSSPPDAPVTLNVSNRPITNLPSGAKSRVSISSPVVVSPTSEPSKYHSNVPAVLSPNEVGIKRTISESSTVPRLPIESAVSGLKRMLLSGINAKASTSVALKPTSDPSK